MNQREFGPLDRSLPVIGQGTWRMEMDDARGAIEALRAGLDAGVTHIDTAEMYGNGAVETLVGEAIAGRRDEVFLTSKVLPTNATRDGTIAACERSLRRLCTDRLDLYLLHWPGDHPLAETIAGFEALVERGDIGAWGVSNFDERGLAEAVAIAGPGRVACNQVLYHLGERAIEHQVVPYCEQSGIAVVAYSPLGAGRFPAPVTKGARVLAEIARDRDASPQQVALAFLIRQQTVFAIPKASRVEHAVDNAAAGDLTLTDDEIGRIDRVFPLRPHRLGVPML